MSEEITQLRRNCFKRDGYKCVVCGRRVTWASGHMAHVIGRGRGGPDTLENVACKCEQCHLEYEHRPKSVPRKVYLQ